MGFDAESPGKVIREPYSSPPTVVPKIGPLVRIPLNPLITNIKQLANAHGFPKEQILVGTTKLEAPKLLVACLQLKDVILSLAQARRRISRAVPTVHEAPFTD